MKRTMTPKATERWFRETFWRFSLVVVYLTGLLVANYIQDQPDWVLWVFAGMIAVHAVALVHFVAEYRRFRRVMAMEADR